VSPEFKGTISKFISNEAPRTKLLKEDEGVFAFDGATDAKSRYPVISRFLVPSPESKGVDQDINAERTPFGYAFRSKGGEGGPKSRSEIEATIPLPFIFNAKT